MANRSGGPGVGLLKERSKRREWSGKQIMDKDYDGEVDGHGGGGGGSSDSSDGQGRSGDSCCGASGGSSTVHESGSSGEFSSFYQGINNHSTV